MSATTLYTMTPIPTMPRIDTIRKVDRLAPKT